MRKPLAFILLSVALICSGCYKDLEVVALDGFTNVELSLKGMTSDMYVEVYNPNFMAVEIVDAEVVLKFGDVDAGDVVLAETVKLAAGDTSLVKLKVATRKGAIGKVLGGQIGMLFEGGSMPFSADGAIVGKAWGMKMEIPVHHSQDLSE